MGKVILIVIDALRYDTALQCMGYMEHLVESQQAARWKVVGELPSFSRPMYETLHTGLTASEHGINHNLQVQRSTKPNIFSAARQHGLTTAAVAYAWYSELYNRTPYDRVGDREVDDPDLLIQHGRFYFDDSYPDTEVFAAAAMLVQRWQPDYLLVHPMGMDFVGEQFGGDSKQYRSKAVALDVMLAMLIPGWLQLSYNILVTADHGISNDGIHGGAEPAMRELPLYMIRPAVPAAGACAEVVSQLQIAPTVCKLLEVPVPETMKIPALV
jgi:predicted AlkP superfamily pyrophosphatase or phosphodiesterase